MKMVHSILPKSDSHYGSLEDFISQFPAAEPFLLAKSSKSTVIRYYFYMPLQNMGTLTYTHTTLDYRFNFINGDDKVLGDYGRLKDICTFEFLL